MIVYLNLSINIFLIQICMIYFTCEKQKKLSILIVFLSFYALVMLNYVTGTTAYIFKIYQLIFNFAIALIFLKGNYKNVITGIFFCMSIQKIANNIPFVIKLLVDKDNLINEMVTFIENSILLNVIFILVFILMVKLIDITALKRYIHETKITYMYAAYIIILYILLYFEYYFIFGDYNYSIKMYINFFTVILPVIALVHTYIKLTSYKIASELNEKIEIYKHENRNQKLH